MNHPDPDLDPGCKFDADLPGSGSEILHDLVQCTVYEGISAHISKGTNSVPDSVPLGYWGYFYSSSGAVFAFYNLLRL